MSTLTKQPTHTPGPWQVSERDETVIESTPLSGKPYLFTLAETYGYLEMRTENAKLIAAAPDLLNAVELLLATLQRVKPSTPFDSTQGTR